MAEVIGVAGKGFTPGRNDQCPCGSGLKVKRCHLRPGGPPDGAAVLVSGAAITSREGIWDGSSGGRLRVYLDAGAGDAVHVFRYARWLAQRGATFVTRRNMHTLFRAQLPVAVDMRDRHPLALTDVHTTSLGLLNLATKGILPRDRAKPYLQAPAPVKLERGRPWKLHVGLCARGDKTQAFDRWRSIHDPKAFAPFDPIPSIAWWTLDDPTLFRDWTDTANLVAGLDLVISVDTGVAHLAGALGVPVLLMDRAPGDGDWGPDERWDEGFLQPGPLYPQTTVIKQQARGSWTDVIEQVRQTLQEKVCQ